MEGHEEERGSCKIDTSVHERFRATRAVLRGRNGAVSFLHVAEVEYCGTPEKLVYMFEYVERCKEAVDTAIKAGEGQRGSDSESLSSLGNRITRQSNHPLFYAPILFRVIGAP